MFSLRSQASYYWPSRPANRGEGTTPGSSVAHIAHSEGVTVVESYAMRDVETADAVDPLEGGIRLHKTLRQEESYA